MASDYSGMDCPREALEQCSEAVARYFSIEADEFHLNFCRASDKGRLQKKVLTHISKTNDGSCVMGDILERLPKRAQQYIAAATPAKNEPREKRERANWHIVEWLQQNRNVCFPRKARSPCSIHGGRCLVFHDHISPTEGPRHPIRLSVAGVTCVRLSCEGAMEGFRARV